jgi:ribonucleoside-triphosphate reductase
MRCMMTAGAALHRDNVAGFNCSYLPIDSPRSFDELMYILLCGTGVGFSVERDYVKAFQKSLTASMRLTLLLLYPTVR